MRKQRSSVHGQYRIIDTDSVELQQAVYGVLHSIEGLDTFADIMTRTHTQEYQYNQNILSRHANEQGLGCDIKFGPLKSSRDYQSAVFKFGAACILILQLQNCPVKHLSLVVIFQIFSDFIWQCCKGLHTGSNLFRVWCKIVMLLDQAIHCILLLGFRRLSISGNKLPETSKGCHQLHVYLGDLIKHYGICTLFHMHDAYWCHCDIIWGRTSWSTTYM